MKMGHVARNQARSQKQPELVRRDRSTEHPGGRRCRTRRSDRLAKVVGDAVTALPEAASRIAKAANLVQHHDVWPLSSGSYLVGSQSDTQAAHLVHRGPWACTCADHTYRHTTCKHILAVQLTIRMGADYTPSYN